MLPYQSISHKEDSIAIVGLGGAGVNILHIFGGSSAENVHLYALSPDERLGRDCGNVNFIQLGEGQNHGMGTGGDPELGRSAIFHSRKRIELILDDIRALVLVVGLGGGTGSGAAPLLAEMAKKAGVYLVTVAVMPFSFEGKRRRQQAEKAFHAVEELSDITLCFENDYMESLFAGEPGAQAVFEKANVLLAQATATVPWLSNSPGLINLGLDELAATLDGEKSRCIFGMGKGYGQDRAAEAVEHLMESPLVAYHNSLSCVRKVLLHIAGGQDMRLQEITAITAAVREKLSGDNVEIFFGTSVKPALGEEIRITLIASVNADEIAAAPALPPAAQAPVPAPEPAPAPAEEAAPAPEPAGVKEEPAAPAPAPEPEPVAEARPAVQPAPTAKVEQPAATPEPTPAPLPAEPMDYPVEEEPPVAPAPRPEPSPAAPQTREGMPEDFLPDFAPKTQRTLDLDGRPRSAARSGREDDNGELDDRINSLFDDIDSGRTAPRPQPAPAPRRHSAEDEMDNPALRFNDLRDMFPE